MTRYGLELFNLCNLTDYLNDFKIDIVSKSLDLDKFSPRTIFINKSKQINIPGVLLELNIQNLVKIGTVENKCYLPNIPIFDHKGIVPENYKGKGIPLAYFSSAIPGSSLKFPAAIEFPENRFVINFDIYETINLIRRELYFTKKRSLYTAIPINIQKIPPSLRQVLAKYLEAGKKRNGQPLFPSYPKDYSVEMLINLLLYIILKIIKVDIALSVWPKGKKYAFMLTHDVDSKWIYQHENLNIFVEMEKRFAVCGAWFFVTNLYRHDFKKIDFLLNEGHEIALHGYNHDHKIAFLPNKEMHKRLSKCRWFIEKYQILGFRSPHYLRTVTFYEALMRYIKYDTSMHDSYNPTSKTDLIREGCSTLYPFKLSEDQDSLLELPITVPEDFKVYNPKNGASSIVEIQLEQIKEIKKRGGLATLVIHPEPHLSARKPFFEAFKEVLRFVSADSECWICRPKDIYRYWIDKKNL